MSSESKPINISDFQKAVEELPDDTLTSIKSQLENSISKLISTNLQLKEEISSLKSQQDIDLYNEVIIENTDVIRNQQQRIEHINDELQKRGLTINVQQSDKVEEKDDVNVEDQNDDSIYL